MRDFLWGQEEGCNNNLVNWESVTKPKTDGGLEIGNLVQRNKSLLGKWLWRFAKEHHSLWHGVIRSSYGRNPGGW